MPWQVTDLEARMTMAKTEAFELQRKLETALKEVGGWCWCGACTSVEWGGTD